MRKQQYNIENNSKNLMQKKKNKKLLLLTKTNENDKWKIKLINPSSVNLKTKKIIFLSLNNVNIDIYLSLPKLNQYGFSCIEKCVKYIHMYMLNLF